VTGSESLQAAPARVMHNKAVRGNPKLQWRPQDVGDARSMDYLLRKAVGSQPKRKAMWTANGKAKEIGLHKPLGDCGETRKHVQLSWLLGLLRPPHLCSKAIPCHLRQTSHRQ
jgi:hypothetical protein